MVPSVAKRGSSFKGAGAYYLHDKGKDTSERVAWTLTHNVPTQDPEKALNWMAYTAIHAEDIKAESGTSRAGAKSQGKPVYAYSLAWHHTDQPNREEMEKAAFSSLEKLGLKNHEAVIVCHQDQEHPHIHVITNLVDPETGKTQAPKMDYKQLSHWAQAHDLEHGRDHCPLRRENNAKRYKDKAKTQFVKHNEKRHERAAMFQAIAYRSKTGQEFRDELDAAGYTLAQGHKGRIVIVDDRGKVFSLTRQLKHENGKGYRAKDLREKLGGVDLKKLPEATALRDIRQGVDRDGYAAEQDDKMFAAAIASDSVKEKAAKDQAKREEQGQQRQKREEAAKSRQEQRHEEASRNRTSFRDGGKVGEEFNAEVQDEQRGQDRQDKQPIHKPKAPQPQLTPFKRGSRSKVSHVAKPEKDKTTKEKFNDTAETAKERQEEERRQIANVMRKRKRGAQLSKSEERISERIDRSPMKETEGEDLSHWKRELPEYKPEQEQEKEQDLDFFSDEPTTEI